MTNSEINVISTTNVHSNIQNQTIIYFAEMVSRV